MSDGGAVYSTVREVFLEEVTCEQNLQEMNNRDSRDLQESIPSSGNSKGKALT